MIAQKARKPEYRRENFAVLRRKRGGEWIVRSYRYNALGMLHAKEATGSNTRTTLEELIAGKEAADDPDGDAEPRTTTYVYDLTQPYYEVLTESTDGKVTSYTYGLERLAAYTESTKTAYLYDGRGSVTQTIQTNNGSFADAIRSSKAYSPFGELLSEKVSGYGFNGEYFDAATGMLNLRARQYEPAQGRFSQKDSEKGYVANARSLNAYLYCYNDGVNYFDADGAKPEVVRNNTTVDPGGGGSSAVRIASTAQNGASANTVANTSPTKSAATGAKVANHAAVSIGYAEKGSESSAVSDAQLEYAFKQGRKPTVRDNSILKEATKGACTDIPHGGHSGKFDLNWIGKWREDIRNFDLDNTDEMVVLESNNFSWYKGHLVIRHSIKWATSCGVFGVIWLNRDTPIDDYGIITVQHENGHLVQEEILRSRYPDVVSDSNFNISMNPGEVMYFLKVAIPSLINRDTKDYYSNPWERGAEYYGEVDPEKRAQYEPPGWKYTFSGEASELYLLSGFEFEDLFADRYDTMKKYEKRWEALQNKNRESFQATPGGRYGYSGRVEMLN